jgi:Holliday junction resolvase
VNGLRRWSGLLKEFVVSNTQRAIFPDFIAKKGKDIYAVEVKTGNAYLLAHQVEILQLAKKHGLDPYILHIKIDIAIKEVSFMKMERYSRKRSLPVSRTT